MTKYQFSKIKNVHYNFFQQKEVFHLSHIIVLTVVLTLKIPMKIL